jgi:hypothetical protein
MKYLVIILFLSIPHKIYSQKSLDSSCFQIDSIEVLFESIEPRNKIIITHF